MATLREKIACERSARKMLELGGLPEPDEIEYGYTCIRLIWWDRKLALVVQIDEIPEEFADDVVGHNLEDGDVIERLRLDLGEEEPMES